MARKTALAACEPPLPPILAGSVTPDVRRRVENSSSRYPKSSRPGSPVARAPIRSAPTAPM